MLLLTPALAMAQMPEVASQAAPIERHDPAVEAAQALIGRALFLRCFCVADTLSFDAEGHPQGSAKAADWTLVGINIQKVERKDPATLELEGVRVAIRFAPDRHEFDRHPLADQKVKVVIPGDGVAVRRTLDAIFAEGIDQRLQRAMPPFWQHYFQPQMPWPADSLDGETVMTPGAPGAPAGIVEPRATNHPDASYTPAATHDRVQGLVMLRLVVDAAGSPRRIAVMQPLGYGLDARAVDAAAKMRFTPATDASGQPVATNVQIRQEFTIVNTPH